MYKQILLLIMITLSIYSAQHEGDESELYKQYHYQIKYVHGTQAEIIKLKSEFNSTRSGKYLTQLSKLYKRYKTKYNTLEKSKCLNFFEGLQSVENLCEHFALITGGYYNHNLIKFK